MNSILFSDQGPYNYDFFYRLSFLIAFLIFLFEGYRRKYPLSTLLLISTVTTLFAVIGSKLSALGPEDWLLVWETGSIPYDIGRSSIGVILFGWLGIGIAQRWLQFKHSVLDLYVIALPAALIFQRVGCLTAGCCFGNPTTLPWGIRYGDYHQIWTHHYVENLSSWEGGLSLPVHPVPVYFIMAYLVIILVALIFRNRLKVNGSQALLGLILLFMFRFLIEFFRDPVTNHGWGELVFGIKKVQLFALGLSLLLTGLLIFREKGGVVSKIRYQTEKYLLQHLSLFVVTFFILFLLNDWFQLSEIVALESMLFFTALAMAWLVFKKVTVPAMRWSTALLLVIAVVTMGQIEVEPPSDAPDYKPKTIKSLTFGLLEGENSYSYIKFRSSSGNSCNSPSDRFTVGPQFYSGGILYESLKERTAKKHLGVGFGAHFSSYDVQKNQDPPRNQLDVGLIAYYHWRWPFHQIKVGGHLGSFTHILDDESQLKFLLPYFNVRVGPRTKYYFEGGLGEDSPYGLMASFWRIGGGVGLPLFGLKNESELRFGFTNIGPDAVFYLSPEIQAGSVRILPTIRFGRGSEFTNYGLSLKYQFNNKN